MFAAINNEKKEIVVFKNAGKLKENENWFYDVNCMRIVNTFTYLGIVLQYNNKINFTETLLFEYGRTEEKQ